MTREHVTDLLPAFALDALSTSEARDVEAHLAGCESCRRELASLRSVTDALATAVPATLPPQMLRARVMDAVTARPSISWRYALVAAAAAVVVALAAVVVSLNQRVAALQARLAAQEQVLALLAAPSAKTAALSGAVEASVRLVYDPGRGQGALVVSDLRDPGREFVYQLWLISGGKPESAGVFRPQAGQAVIVPLTVDFTRYQAVAISVERGPRGAAQPTSAPVLAASI